MPEKKTAENAPQWFFYYLGPDPRLIDKDAMSVLLAEIKSLIIQVATIFIKKR